MGAGDAITAALILGGALWLLWRSLFARKGGCHGCTSTACRPGPRETSLVRLGTGRPPASPPPGGR